MKLLKDPELGDRSVVELIVQKLKLNGPKLNSLNLAQNHRIMGVRFGLKVYKECLIEIEVSNNVHISQRKRILLSTQVSGAEAS